jgi:methylated-DNA-[protein]-cysteine S-methyltransferase
MAILKLPTPVGELTLVASDTALLAVHFPPDRDVPPLHAVERGSGGEAPIVEQGSGGEAPIVEQGSGGEAPIVEQGSGGETPIVEQGSGGETPIVEQGSGGEAPIVGRGDQVLARARQQLEEYFARARTTFDLPLDPVGSAFQRRVWDALRAIPYGTTVSYSEIARRLGDVRATRAVGAANGQNPIPIIVPCHRVVGAHGELTGFGGGIDRKRWLLEHEGALLTLGG